MTPAELLQRAGAGLMQRVRDEASPPGIEVIRRRHPARPVAFLACHESASELLVLPLKRGLNRVGASSMWGDHDMETRRPKLMEARQWLIVCLEDSVLVADDHSTNGSACVRGRMESWPDRAFESLGRLLEMEEADDVTILDWEGDTVGRVETGHVLVNCYRWLVFGRL